MKIFICPKCPKTIRKNRHVKRYIIPEIEYFPPTYLHGEKIIYGSLRIIFWFRTIHLIFNGTKKNRLRIRHEAEQKWMERENKL